MADEYLLDFAFWACCKRTQSIKTLALASTSPIAIGENYRLHNPRADLEITTCMLKSGMRLGLINANPGRLFAAPAAGPRVRGN